MLCIDTEADGMRPSTLGLRDTSFSPGSTIPGIFHVVFVGGRTAGYCSDNVLLYT